MHLRLITEKSMQAFERAMQDDKIIEIDDDTINICSEIIQGENFKRCSISSLEYQLKHQYHASNFRSIYSKLFFEQKLIFK